MTDHKEYFTIQFKRLSDYFGLKITKSQLDSYYEQLYYIEQDALRIIIDRIISDRKPFKTQFPIISEFGPLYESISSFDRPVSEFTEEPCEECGMIGLIFYKYWHREHGIIYTATAACPKCSNWKKHFNTLDEHKVFSSGHFICKHPKIPMMTRFELEQKSDVVEVAGKGGVFLMNQKQLSEKVLEIYGKVATD